MNKNGNTDRHFKGQLDTEVVQCFYRKHWVVLVRDILEFIIFITALTIVVMQFKGIYVFFSQDSFFITFLAFSIVGLFTIFIHKFFLRLIRYYLDIAIITNYRIVNIDKSLYLQDSKDAIDLPKIQDIQKSQHGIMKKIFNFGELIITLSSTVTTKILDFVPNPEYHFRKINTLKREYIKEKLLYRRPNKENPVKGSASSQSFSNKVEFIDEESISGLS